MTNTTTSKTRKLVGTAVLTAIVIVLQLLGSFIRFGPFSISLVLVPIVIGAALYGVWSGAWLGFVFGAAVLLSGDAAAFLAIDVFGAIVVCLLKGFLAGLLAGIVYRPIAKKNDIVGTVAAAITAPIVNTGIFLLGCVVFFLPTVRMWGESAGFTNVGVYMITGFVGLNFVFELLVNVILSPVIVRLVRIARKTAK